MNSKVDEEDQQAYLQPLSFPVGFRFHPSDHQLVYYLKKKINDKPLQLPPNIIIDVELYNYDPDTLTKLCKNKSSSGKIDEWYFFTRRDNRNGKKPGRAAGNGYWKITTTSKRVMFNGKLLGLKKSLTFFRGKTPKGERTNWLMHEYVLSHNPTALEKNGNGDDDMQLDKWVACRVYKREKDPDVKSNYKKWEVEATDSVLANDLTETTQNQEESGIFSPPQFDHQRQNLQQVEEQDFNMLPVSQTQSCLMPYYTTKIDNAFDNYNFSAFGGLPDQFPESLDDHPFIILDHDSTICSQQQATISDSLIEISDLISDSGTFIPAPALPVTSIAPDPQQFHYKDGAT